jgi:hypothetical protein
VPISGEGLVAWLSGFVVTVSGMTALAQASAQHEHDSEIPTPLILVQSGGGQFVPDLPGTPMPTYQLQFPDAANWPGEAAIIADIKARVNPEDLEVVSINPVTRTFVVKTTRFAAENKLYNVPGELSLLKDAGPELRCARIMAEVVAGDIPSYGSNRIEWVRRDNAECVANRRFLPLQNLVAEGIDSQGTQLFVVITRDPRWYHHETFSDEGKPIPGPEGKGEWSSMALRIEAPISDELTQIRIWEMKPEGQLSVIAEIPFEVPKWLN